MKRGVIAGKFLPPHNGHSYLINTAAAQCDELTVLICDRPEYLIPAELRKLWLEELHPDVHFVIVKDVLDDDDSPAWAAATIKLLGVKPDLVFSSEEYGERWAACMGAKHILVDQARVHQPISGTLVRDNPWKHWEFLSEPVEAFFAYRICLVGSESTGTTTLTKALAEHYHTNWVPEYGRQYSVDEADRLAKEGWKTADFVKIAMTQNAMEDEAARHANKVLFCDTDSFATSIWHERYMGHRTYEVEAQAADRNYTLYLLTDVNIPWEDDGTRDGEAYRQWMHERFQEKLKFWGKPYVIITGSKEERLQQAIKILDKIFKDQAVKVPGLTRNTWHHQGGF